MRYYDIATHTEVLEESDTTIPETDDRVKDFFKPLKENEYVIYINDLPIIKKLNI